MTVAKYLAISFGAWSAAALLVGLFLGRVFGRLSNLNDWEQR